MRRCERAGPAVPPPCFGPLALFHVEGKEAIEERATSIQNAAEARMVLALYQELRARYSHLSSSNQIAVISPYKAQVLHVPALLPTSFSRKPAHTYGIVRIRTLVA